ncbi:MAG: ArsC/Spx/MgsR family protein, partial [Ghiorsea sp.]|nr:ArsC/Spx/MgsR family protein [Ghiorsea sp.]
KKAKDALTAKGLDFEFYNYKKDGIDESTLESWCGQVGWKTLLNQRGTTWRKLSADDKDGINHDNAIKLMSLYPSMIKRPVLVVGDKIIVGFDEQVYAEL